MDINNLPKKIYLQVVGSAKFGDGDYDFKKLRKTGEITWNDEQIFEHDVSYTLAALEPSPLPLIETGQDAIEFAEFIDDNFKNYEYRGKYSWSKKFPDQNTMIAVSTKSLYELFKNSKQ